MKLKSIIGIVIVVSLTGCATLKVKTPHDYGDSVDIPDQSITVYPYTIVKAQRDEVIEECKSSEGLNHVIIKRNFGQFLVSLFTLGAVQKFKIQVECSKGKATDEEFE